jgi:hypothetical protein
LDGECLAHARGAQSYSEFALRLENPANSADLPGVLLRAILNWLEGTLERDGPEVRAIRRAD